MTDPKELVSESDTLRVYEVGYLLLPSVPEDRIPEHISHLKETIAKVGATVISEEIPTMRTLAYDMVKHIGTSNVLFKTAYFGWIKFEALPAAAVELKKRIDAIEEVLRFIIVKTVREVPISKPASSAKEEGASPKEESAESGEVASSVQISSEEIDKSIEDLIKE